MSRTISVGIYGPRYWSSMAFTLSENLEETLMDRIPRNIQPTVQKDALRFLRLALGVRVEATQNESSCINAYRIAANAYRTVTHNAGAKMTTILSTLLLYVHLLEKLQLEEELTKADFQAIISARDFFRVLADPRQP